MESAPSQRRCAVLFPSAGMRPAVTAPASSVRMLANSTGPVVTRTHPSRMVAPRTSQYQRCNDHSRLAPSPCTSVRAR
jgi:hypothetical protein